MWVRIGSNPGLLLLAVYGPHAGTKMHIREAFWQSRFSELQLLRKKPEFANCRLICLGDFNLHFPALGAANTRMASRLDRHLQELFTSVAGFGCILFNPTDVASHASGSIIDVVAATPALNPMVSIEWCDEGLLRSDHAFIKVVLPDEPFTVSVEPERGEARWGTGAEWEQALESVNHALSFIAGWAATVLTNAEILSWVRKGSKKRTRLYLLNKACWWRSVVVTLAGHFSGIVVLAGPRAQHRDLFGEIQKHLNVNWDEEDALFDDNGTLYDMQACLHKDRVAKYMRLSQCDKQAAQSFLTKLLKPKMPIRTGFINPSTGERLGEYETMLHLARDVETRGLAAHSGQPGFNSWVTDHCSALRKLALQSCGVEPNFIIKFDELMGLINGLTLNRASVHFPRRLFSASSTEGHILTWTLVNLFFNLGLLPSSWFRIISPIRKRGPAIVANTANIRPISYVSDLEGFFDLCWLDAHKTALEEYSGSTQAGGKFEALLMALGVITAAQERRNLGLQTFILKADLLQGFDLLWRDAVRIHAWEAGIKGKSWLVLDHSLSNDQARIRLGPLLGPFFSLEKEGIRQGGRAAVHLFGAVVKELNSFVPDAVPGIGLGLNRAVVRAADLGERKKVGTVEPLWPLLHMASSDVDLQATESAMRQNVPGLLSTQDATILLDLVAPHKMLCLQFVDDCFILQSTTWGLQKVCNALGAFAQLWRHRFAGGSKAASVMLVGDNQSTLPPITVDGHEVNICQVSDILGIRVDKQLSFQPLLELIQAKFMEAARAVGTGLDSHGLGIIWHLEQFQGRVINAALFGAEVLVCHIDGWGAIVRKMNLLHYRALKVTLGIERFSLGIDGYSRLLSLTNSWRLSSKLAVRIICTLARMLTLPPTNPVAAVVESALASTEETWISAAKNLALSFNIMTIPQWSTLPSDCTESSEKKKFLLQWKRDVVIPAIRFVEEAWKQDQEPTNLHLSATQLQQIIGWTRRIYFTPFLRKRFHEWLVAALSGHDEDSCQCHHFDMPAGPVDLRRRILLFQQ